MRCSLSFVELTVRDWPAAVAWYQRALGLELVLRNESDRFALFAAGQGRLALKEGEPKAGGALLAFEVENLDGWLSRLAQEQIALDGPIKTSPEGYRRARLKDLDGHALTLFEWVR